MRAQRRVLKSEGTRNQLGFILTLLVPIDRMKVAAAPTIGVVRDQSNMRRNLSEKIHLLQILTFKKQQNVSNE